jgi:hypothetical protein
MSAQFEVKAERGNWSGKGDLLEAVEVIEANVAAENEELAPMALDIIEKQMDGLEVGGTLAYNWACSVLDVMVKRVA